MLLHSRLDTDLYKLTMMQAVRRHFPTATAEYRFRCRTPGIELCPVAPALREELEALAELRFKPGELDYLATLPYFRPEFLAHLRGFRLQPQAVELVTGQGFELAVRGPWQDTILYEVPLLALINELYFRGLCPEPDYREGRRRLADKIALVGSHPHGDDFRFGDFGTRRRFSRAWQAELLERVRDALPEQFIGTSNVALARALGLRPIGTMAHEFIQACQVLAPELSGSQKFAFSLWLEEYGDRLAIALSDTYGMEAFFRDFDAGLARRYEGIRQDSGAPYAWGERLLAHYERLGIDPRGKTLVFSDALTFPLALKLHEHFRTRIRPVFGIGTNLTNDLGPEPIQIVLKMTGCNGRPVAKISDSPDKTMGGDEAYREELRRVFGLQH